MGLSIRHGAGHEAAPPMAGGSSIVYMNTMPKQAARQNRSLLIVMVAMMAIVAVAVVVMWRIVESGPRDQVTGAGSGISIGGPFTLTDQSGAAVSDKTYDGSYRLI